MSTSSFPCLLQRFFTERLLGQLDASPHTVAAYRNTFRLFLQFASTQLGREPSQLRVEDLHATFVANFLDHLEKARKNCARTRNHRLAALHSFFRHVAVTEPALALQCQQVLAMPCKRYERRTVEFLTEEECAALLATPNLGTWVGRRDRALLLLAIETGFRNSELTALKRQDISFGTGAHVRCLGKGRKMRCTPLRSEVVTVLAEWVAQQK